ncbi:hypothetical protein PNA2_1009 [Pyrococcus sp. NA2]|uniref:hypothetical protein n=1 Tax=Pyrococcus sp. (strain NA2) TaxID=342949 RepID=UPI000209A9F0|nr:hypothetical protein [Pyrococcus sp. NA2]AEC51925.1 hypothetical protein PNA2_1009 [Pyrococcus sp. NA2]
MRLRIELLVGASLAIIGAVILLYSAVSGNSEMINIGFAGIFLGAIVLTIKGKEYVKRDTLSLTLRSYHESIKRMVEDLELEGNSLYIPPYENLPRGWTFIPLHKDFDIDPGRFGEDIAFLTNVGSERQMGLLLKPLGLELLEKFEEHLEGEITSVGELESASSSVLRALGLANGVYIEEEGESFTIYVTPEDIGFCRRNIKYCNKVACPICSSILLGLAKATNEIIEAKNFSIEGERVKIEARKLGGVREWM